MSWIKTIGRKDADPTLRKTYDRVADSNQQIDNILLAHSLRPHTLVGHMTLYKSVLHHNANQHPKSLLETLGVCVSMLNQCDYCVRHHAVGLRRLLNDDARYEQVMRALKDFVSNKGCNSSSLSDQEMAAIEYAGTLTRNPADVTEQLLDKLRAAGFDDGGILEINQVVSYFAYANRTVLGLGVSIQGETLGLSPNDSSDPSNWTHD